MAKQGQQTITLDGPGGDASEKKLRFTVAALCELEEALGKPATWYFQSVEERLGFREISAFVHAGMRGAGSTFKLKDVRARMNVKRTAEYTEAIGKALQEAFGKGEEKEENDPLPHTDPNQNGGTVE